MQKEKVSYKQCAIATLTLWAIYLLVIVIGMSIYTYIEMGRYSNSSMDWIFNLANLSIPFVPSLIAFFILIRQYLSRIVIVFITASIFIVAYNITLQVWMMQDGMQSEQSFVGLIIMSTILFLLISLYSWIVLKLIKYRK